jgi:hypothetical protein
MVGIFTDILKGEVLEIEIPGSEKEEEIEGLVEGLEVEVIISDNADCYRERKQALSIG